jgi:hypothetical protein
MMHITTIPQIQGESVYSALQDSSYALFLSRFQNTLVTLELWNGTMTETFTTIVKDASLQ